MKTIASIPQRIVGGFIDLFFLFVFSALFGDITGLAKHPEHGIGFSLQGLPFIIAISVCFVLFGLMEYLTGKTPGKYITKTRVLASNYEKIGFWQALIRNIFRLIDIIGFYIVGLFFIIFTKKNQRLGDLVAKTYVVSER